MTSDPLQADCIAQVGPVLNPNYSKSKFPIYWIGPDLQHLELGSSLDSSHVKHLIYLFWPFVFNLVFYTINRRERPNPIVVRFGYLGVELWMI